MSQYFCMSNLTKLEYFHPHHVNTSAKLMEISNFLSRPTLFLCELLRTSWNKDVVVVCGDYYEGEIPRKIFNKIQLLPNEDYNLFYLSNIKFKKVNLKEFEELNEPIKDSYEGPKRIGLRFYGRNRFFINYSKKLYVDLYEYFRYRTENVDDIDIILNVESPVILLITLGNGISSSDYTGYNEDLVGSWAYDRVGISDKLSGKLTEVEINFKYDKKENICL